MEIFKSEEASCSADDLKTIINQYYPDIRKMLNTIQLSIQDGKVVIEFKNLLTGTDTTSEVDLLVLLLVLPLVGLFLE